VCDRDGTLGSARDESKTRDEGTGRTSALVISHGGDGNGCSFGLSRGLPPTVSEPPLKHCSTSVCLRLTGAQ